MKIQGNIEWSLTKEQVEFEMGKKISDEEFTLFGKHFEENFKAQFEATLEWQVSDWDEVKTWELSEEINK